MKKLFSNLILVSTLIFSVNINAEPITVPMVIVSIEVDQQPTSSVGFSIPFTDNSWDFADPYPDYLGLISIPTDKDCFFIGNNGPSLRINNDYAKKMIGNSMPSKYAKEEDLNTTLQDQATANAALIDAFALYDADKAHKVCETILYYANDYIITTGKGIENYEKGRFQELYENDENKKEVYNQLPWSVGTVKNTSLNESYKITRIYKNVKLKNGDKLFFHFEDHDAVTNDMIGKGELIFNGDQVLEGRIGAMDVKVEFVFN